MAGIELWVPIAYFFCLCAVTFGTIRFLLGLRKDALTNKDVRFFQVLVIVWLFLMVGHSFALFAVHSSPLFAAAPTVATLMWWTIVNLMLANLLSLHRQVLAAKTMRALLWCAIAVCGALLLTWPLALGVAAIPHTLPIDLTLGLSAPVVIALGVLSFLTWKAPHGQGGKSSAKREDVQQNANHL